MSLYLFLPNINILVTQQTCRLTVTDVFFWSKYLLSAAACLPWAACCGDIKRAQWNLKEVSIASSIQYVSHTSILGPVGQVRWAAFLKIIIQVIVSQTEWITKSVLPLLPWLASHKSLVPIVGDRFDLNQGRSTADGPTVAYRAVAPGTYHILVCW